jgi:hypothetical protein
MAERFAGMDLNNSVRSAVYKRKIILNIHLSIMNYHKG